MVRKKTDLPVGDAFAPAQIRKRLDDADFDDYEVEHTDEELPVMLELAKQFEGDPDAFDRAIEDLFYPDPKQALTVKAGMGPRGYQIVDESRKHLHLGSSLKQQSGCSPNNTFQSSSATLAYDRQRVSSERLGGWFPVLCWSTDGVSGYVLAPLSIKYRGCGESD